MSRKYNFIETAVLLLRVVVLGVLMVPYIFVQTLLKIAENKKANRDIPL
jgi:hypothetical protein